jgi:hypothetical protein
LSVHYFTIAVAAAAEAAAEAAAVAAAAAAEAAAAEAAALGVSSPLRVSAAAEAYRNLVAHRLVMFPAVLLLRGRHSNRSDQGASR